MTIPKEIASKIYEYQKAKEKADALYEEIEDYFNTIDNSCYYTDFKITNNYSGKLQNNGEYCDEYFKYEDSCNGIYYYPIENCDEFSTNNNKATYAAIYYEY